MKTRIRQLTEQEKRSLGESQMIADWLKIFDKGILSIVSDTFDLWKLITEYLPANKEVIMARDGKLVIRPDSGDPVDIICGTGETIVLNFPDKNDGKDFEIKSSIGKGVIELLWDIFGGTINNQGFKVLDPHIGAIYGDSITPNRQKQIYERLAAKGFAATNIVLGVGSFTYQYNTRDTFGFAMKATYGEIKLHDVEGLPEGSFKYEPREIFKDPITDDGTKKSKKGLLQVDLFEKHNGNCDMMGCDMNGCMGICKELSVKDQCTWEQEQTGLLTTIFKDGKLLKETTLDEIRTKLNEK